MTEGEIEEKGSDKKVERQIVMVSFFLWGDGLVVSLLLLSDTSQVCVCVCVGWGG